MYRIIETISACAPLGIRFWDPVLNHAVKDGLSVTARPEDADHPMVNAGRTRSGIYAFKRLPGMRDVESHSGTPLSPPAAHVYIIEVRDQRRRFIDVGFEVTLPLPYKGLFLSRSPCQMISSPPGSPLPSPPNSPPDSAPKGFNLYSSPVRSLPLMIPAVRGELLDVNTGRPAAHSLLRVDTPDGFSWFGIADDSGRFAVLLPYPALMDGLGGSPLENSRKRLSEQVWELTLYVHFDPSFVNGLPGSTLKDYRGILCQPRAAIWSHAPGGGQLPSYEYDINLKFGKEVIVKTDGFSSLLVSPDVSSP